MLFKKSLSVSESALDARARRAALSAGYVAMKSRWRSNSVDNFGGFAIVEPGSRLVVAGQRFDLTPEEVIAWCKAD